MIGSDEGSVVFNHNAIAFNDGLGAGKVVPVREGVSNDKNVGDCDENSSCSSLQLFVLCFGSLKYRDVWISVSPEGKEVFVS